MSDIPEAAIEAACHAQLMEQTQGLCDSWPGNCDGCDCFRSEVTAAYERQHMRAAITAALEVMQR